MRIDEVIQAYSCLPHGQQLRVLVKFAHDLTIIARGTYVPQTEEMADPRRFRMLNE